MPESEVREVDSQHRTLTYLLRESDRWRIATVAAALSLNVDPDATAEDWERLLDRIEAALSRVGLPDDVE